MTVRFEKERFMKGFGITIIPMSWHFGFWDIGKKALFAVGPIRFVLYRNIEGKYGERRGVLERA